MNKGGKYDRIKVMGIFGGSEAKNLTAAIDRETDAAVLAKAESTETGAEAERAVGVSTAGVDGLAEKARAEAAKTEVHELEQGAGWQAGEVSVETRALGGAALEQAVIASNEAIKEQVAIENGYVDTGLEAGQNVIGGESKEQIKARTREDLEDAQMELRVDLPPELMDEAKLLARNQENLAKGAVGALDQMVRRRDAKPWQIERQVWQIRLKMYSTIGREFGGRN